MKKYKRGLCLLLSVIMILSLSACKKGGHNTTGAAGKDVFAESQKLNWDMSGIVSAELSGDTIVYLFSAIYQKDAYEQKNSGWIIGKTDGSMGDLVEVYVGKGMIYDVCYIPGEGIYACQSIFDESIQDYSMVLVLYSETGEEIKKAEYDCDTSAYYRGELDSEGRTVLYAGKNAAVFDKDGKKIADVEVPFDTEANFVPSSTENGGMIFYGLDSSVEGGRVFSRLDMSTGSFGGVFPTKEAGDFVVAQSGYGEDFYMKAAGKLYAYDSETGDVRTYMDFEESDVAPTTVRCALPVNENTVILFIDTKGAGGGGEPYIYTRVNPEEIVEKTVITIGGDRLYWAKEVENYISEYNKSNDRYRIVSKDYYTENGQNFDAASEAMRNDLITGQGPDIMVFTPYSTSPESFMKRGILTDLTPYMEEAGIPVSSFLPNVMETGALNGKQYVFTPRFSVAGAGFTKEEYLNESGGLSIQDIMNLRKKYNVEGSGLGFSDSDSVLGTALMYTSDNFYSIKNGECRFDSDDFMELLNWIQDCEDAQNTEEYEYAEDIDFKALVATNRCFYESGGGVFSNFRDMYRVDYRDFDGEGVLTGFPSADGNGKGMIQPAFSLGINVQCENPEGAFDFIRYFMEDEYQNNQRGPVEDNYFPSKLSGFETCAEQSMQKPFVRDTKSGEWEQVEEYYYGPHFQKEEIPVMNESQVQKYKDYVLGCEGLADYDQKIINIVEEELGAFFEEQKSADEVTEIIQNRVDNYIREQQ